MKIEPLAKHRHWIPQLAAWHHAQWSDFNPGESLAGRVFRLEMNATGDELPLTWVAFDSDAPLGSASLVPSDLETRPELKPWLASVFVSPNHRKKGIGSALVQHVTREAKTRGFPSLYLFTPNQQRLYERLGWREMEELDYCGNRVTLMRFDFPENG